ncbi:hypothetical protein ADIS_1487 [Lunatimonas lonarensis]|uniref:DinB-like domain-containing protein n=1 Tax=Lunatimonas lonarensis TaxID=1232681 RepID=R7ZV90_9BACT|nr:DinB family protein [Lunatimonas lonarensis]EON77948.1 hypothetical protein ADIS_1487 [Lunatimonas lonarensis]
MKEIADQWQMRITELTWGFEQLLEDLPSTKFNRKPSAGAWSVAEIVDHLIRVNRSYFPIFDAILAGTYPKPLLAYIPPIGKKTGELILKSLRKPDKVKTFEPWEPQKRLLDGSIVREFYALQHELSAYIQRLDLHFEQNLMISSPINRWIVYPLDTAVHIILAHEQRHLAQIQNHLAQLSGDT